MGKKTNVIDLLKFINKFLSDYEEYNRSINNSQTFINYINIAIDIINTLLKYTNNNIGDNLNYALKQIDERIKAVRFKDLLKDLIGIVKKYFDGETNLFWAKKLLEERINTHKDGDYILPRELLKEQLTYIQDAIKQILPLKSKEDEKQVNFALNVINQLIDVISHTNDETISVHLSTRSLQAASEDNENEAKLMNEILNTVFIKMTANVEPETLSMLVKDSINSVLAPYKPKTNYLTILYWILIAIVVIVGILFILGLILGFIYAIRAERFNEKWSTKRVLGRTLLGFAFVAMYWNKYGIW